MDRTGLLPARDLVGPELVRFVAERRCSPPYTHIPHCRCPRRVHALSCRVLCLGFIRPWLSRRSRPDDGECHGRYSRRWLMQIVSAGVCSHARRLHMVVWKILLWLLVPSTVIPTLTMISSELFPGSFGTPVEPLTPSPFRWSSRSAPVWAH